MIWSVIARDPGEPHCWLKDIKKRDCSFLKCMWGSQIILGKHLVHRCDKDGSDIILLPGNYWSEAYQETQYLQAHMVDVQRCHRVVMKWFDFSYFFKSVCNEILSWGYFYYKVLHETFFLCDVPIYTKETNVYHKTFVIAIYLWDTSFSGKM